MINLEKMEILLFWLYSCFLRALQCEEFHLCTQCCDCWDCSVTACSLRISALCNLNNSKSQVSLIETGLKV